MHRRFLVLVLLALLASTAAAHAASPRTTLRKANAALDRGAGARGGREVTPLLKQLALQLPRLKGAARSRAARLLARPTIGQGASGELEYEVPEAPPYCSAHFCVHYVTSTADKPPLSDVNHNSIPDYVEAMSFVFEHVYQVENGDLHWRAPKSDGRRGCGSNAPSNCPGKTDVYIKEVGDQGIYGYSAPDPGQRGSRQYAYLVMDNDYNASQFPQYGGNPFPPMEVTAAHEYNHVLQFNYDIDEDVWMFESTATWMEDRVYTEVNDYLQYMTPWARMTAVPITYFSYDGNDPLNVKVYGDAVWNRWLDARFGPNVVRDAWAASLAAKPASYAPAAYSAALKPLHSGFFRAFSQFAIDTAEWRASNSAFAEGSTFPDVDRKLSPSHRPFALLPDRSSDASKLDHTSYVLLDVAPQAGLPRLKFAVSTPRGTGMAIALVGRVGDEVHGTAHEFVKLLPKGGPGVVTISNPGQYDRITGVVVNADSAATWDSVGADWNYRHDRQVISARTSTDNRAPYVKHRRPVRNARAASPRARVTIVFSERMFGINSKTVTLLDRKGHAVRAKIAGTVGGKKRSAAAGIDKVVLTPSKKLAKHARYRVRLSNDLRDFGGNALRRSALSWSFTTRR